MDGIADRVRELLATRDVALDDVLLIAEAGSTMHGVGVGAQDDLDLVAVRIEQFAELVDGPPRRQSMMIRTQPEGARSGPGDIDLNVYTLRRFAHLVASGNPTLLNTLFVPDYYLRHEHFPLQEFRERIDRRRAGNAYLGYLAQQLSKWQGEDAVGRAELIDQFGFDTKYAYHAIRLGLQGYEFLTTGRITLPIAEPERSRLAELRTGGYTEAQAQEWAAEVEARLKVVVEEADFAPPSPISPLLTAAYREWYDRTG